MLKIENLTKSYGEKRAVDDLSLHIRPGEIYGFIGHNGAGKTTTIKAACGILQYDSGEIFLDGVSMKEDPIRAKASLAYIPDNPDLYDYLTGIQYLNFIADVFELSAEERKSAIETEAHDFGIYDSLGDLISSYSHGMKQKLAIIGALIHHPRLLILDEPFVGLDPEAALKLKEKMKALCAEGSAVFFSTHVLDVAEKLCNRIAMISHGKLVLEGNTEEVMGNKSLEQIFMEVAANGKTD